MLVNDKSLDDEAALSQHEVTRLLELCLYAMHQIIRMPKHISVAMMSQVYPTAANLVMVDVKQRYFPTYFLDMTCGLHNVLFHVSGLMCS